MQFPLTLNRRRLRALVLWCVFCAGLTVQAFAPRLTIENDAFVIPQARDAHNAQFADPVKLVRTERRMQALSALLSLAGALGLAWHYGRRHPAPE